MADKYRTTFSKEPSVQDSDLYGEILKEVEEKLKTATSEERLAFFSDIIDGLTSLNDIESLELDIPILQVSSVFSREEIGQLEVMLRAKKEKLLYQNDPEK